MFCIKPKDIADWQHALFILSHFVVRCEMYSDTEDETTTFMVVDNEYDRYNEHVGAVRMAEAAFQMDWRQKGGPLCPLCEMTNKTAEEHGCIKVETCGHLTFNARINPAF